MATTGKLKIDFTVRYKWLILLINYPLVKLGFEPYVPRICIKMGKPYFESEFTGP